MDPLEDIENEIGFRVDAEEHVPVVGEVEDEEQLYNAPEVIARVEAQLTEIELIPFPYWVQIMY